MKCFSYSFLVQYYVFQTSLIAKMAEAEISTQTTPEDEIVFSITKADMNKIKSDFNRANWNNLNELIIALVRSDCEIFGGAARDIVYRDYNANIFYKEYAKAMDNPRASPEEYDDPNLFPETYAGRTLLPTDLDVFIKGNDNFEKVCKYLKETYKCTVYNNQDISENNEPREPYFIETNPELKKVLKYYHIVINGLTINTQMRRLLGVFKMFLPEIILQKFEKGVVMKLDVIVLADNWRKVHLDNYHDEYDLSPPFKNPDFRCNQLSLVKQANWPFYKLKTNCSFIPRGFEYNNDGIIACMSTELKMIQREVDNLKIITDDIIAKRAIPVISTKLVAPNRIVKMEKKGYTVDIVSMLPKQLIHKAPLQPDDKCIICFEEFTTGSIMLKPCECSGLMHEVCWAQLVKMENTNHRYHNSCPNCRHQQDICIRYSEHVKTCKLANMLSALEHYRTDVAMQPYRQMVCNMCTRTHHDTYNYEQDDVD